MSFTPTPQQPRKPASTNLIIGVMVMAAFVMILNETTVSIALSELSKTLDVSIATVQWLMSGFLVTMAVVIPMTGFLLDRFSPRAIFLVAITSFALGSTLCAIAPNFGALLTGRVVQASGTAVMIPLVMTTVMRLVPADRRGAMMGTISIVIGVGPAIGPTVGGAILSAMSWQWMFWMGVILAAILFIFGYFRLHAPSEKKQTPLDILSVILSALGFAGLVYGLSSIGQTQVPVPPWAALVISIVALACFIWRQIVLQREDRPLLDLRTLKYGRFRLGIVMSVMVFMALLGAGAILLPIYLQDILGHGTFTAGLALLPGGLSMAAVSRPAGSLYDRFGARVLVAPGAIGMTSALWIFSLLGDDVPLGFVIATHMLLMISLGLMMTPLMADALGSLPAYLDSHGSAIFATLQQVAGALGSAVFVTVAAIASTTVSETPDARGLDTAFLVAGCVAFVGIIFAFMFKKPAADVEPTTT